MQKKEAAHGVVDGGVWCRCIGNPCVDMRIVLELARAVGDLHTGHVDDVQPSPAANPFCEILGEVSVDAGSLEHPHSDLDLLQQRLLQALVVAEQDGGHHPRSIEECKSARIEIGPGVGIPEVGGHARADFDVRDRTAACDDGHYSARVAGVSRRAGARRPECRALRLVSGHSRTLRGCSGVS